MELRALAHHLPLPSFSSSLLSELTLHSLGDPRKKALRGSSIKVEQNVDLPQPPPRHKKKPWITPPKRGGFLRKLRRGEPTLRELLTPSNGLLVTSLIPVAHDILRAHSALIQLVPKLMDVVPVQVCKFCGEVHIGPVGHRIATCNGPDAGKRFSRHVWTAAKVDDVMPHLHTYHLYDRLRTVTHTERFKAVRIPAIVELCIQAGVELPEFPTLRRTHPVKAIGRQLIEEDVSRFKFDDDIEKGLFDIEENSDEHDEPIFSAQDEYDETFSDEQSNQEEETDEEEAERYSITSNLDHPMNSTSELAERTLATWITMRNDVKRLMKKYIVKVCGYCPEIHVGPRGHKVKDCGAFKHQWRAGQHGWQKATIDDFIPPKYVWHVNDLLSPRLENELRRYYGKAPAIVELCVQAGAEVPSEFRAMMRLDVVVPDVNEMYNAV